MNLIFRIAIIAILCFVVSLKAFSQTIGIKSNLLYDLTSTLNLAGEIRCDDTHTFNLSLNYNPWSFKDNRKMKLFMLQPEYRKWFSGAFIGHFIGLQAHYGIYNWGGMLPWKIKNSQLENNRYQGTMIGCGISYGYQWIISTHWNLETGISFGYAHFNYKRYGSSKSAPLIEKSNDNYWGPTQAGISFIYFLK